MLQKMQREWIFLLQNRLSSKLKIKIQPNAVYKKFSQNKVTKKTKNRARGEKYTKQMQAERE